MELLIPQGRLRPFQKEDAPQISKIADNYKIWRNLRDEFPRPYTLKDAENWVELCQSLPEVSKFAIEIDGKVQGGIGFNTKAGKNYAHIFEMGYWLSEEYWGRGIVSSAIPVMLDYAFNTLGKKRVYACSFSMNPTSIHLLRKSGFIEEGIARRAVKKEGEYYDEYRFGLLADEFNAQRASKVSK